MDRRADRVGQARRGDLLGPQARLPRPAARRSPAQFAALEEPEPDEHVLVVPIGRTPEQVVAEIIARLRLHDVEDAK